MPGCGEMETCGCGAALVKLLAQSDTTTPPTGSTAERHSAE